MPRKPRIAPSGYLQHVFNRAAGKTRMLAKEKDFIAFENLLIEAHERNPIRILSYCLMATHWNFVVWPGKEGQVTEFFRWLTHSHAVRWRMTHRDAGYGPLYAGRFKTFVIQRDGHLLTACRHVERSALTAGLVERAQDWRWSSLYVRQNGTDEMRSILSSWPVERPSDWVRQVNKAISSEEKEAMQLAIYRSRPFGDEKWVATTAKKLDLGHTLRRPGRPSKAAGAPGKK